MKYEVYSVFDDKAAAFLTPFTAQNQAVALRLVSDCLSDPNHMFAMHPGDYTVYHLGYFDSATGDLTAIKAEFVCQVNGLQREYTIISDGEDA